jgi:hypothetical protein
MPWVKTFAAWLALSAALPSQPEEILRLIKVVGWPLLDPSA